MDQCRERLEKEIAEAAPPNSRVKVTSPATPSSAASASGSVRLEPSAVCSLPA